MHDPRYCLTSNFKLRKLLLSWTFFATIGSYDVAEPANANPTAEHVIHISIDGLRGDLLEANINAAPEEHANFWRFVNEGATTFNARTDYTNTRTVPNHTTMITGRPVDQPGGTSNTTHHGYTHNGSVLPSHTLHNLGNSNLSYLASTFDVAHDHGLSTALYVSKDKFAVFEQSYGTATGAPDLTGPDDGRDKIDSYHNSLGVQQSFINDMAINQFNYTFLHYVHPDGVGHGAGWGSDAWNSIVELMDDYVGEIFDLVETTPNLTDNTIVILTADHGGEGTGHGTAEDPENYTIPLFVWGRGVAPSADLYALNPTSRENPGPGRPSYTAANQPLRNGGTANLALHLLGLGPVPGSTINFDQDLLVASLYAADFDANQLVDGDDLLIWLQGYATSAEANKASGDSNEDGNIDGRDFLNWQRERNHFPAAHTAHVPEPTALGLLLIGLLSSQPRLQRRPNWNAVR